jgi:energy-coupling factor transporter ATP-binding protein EcfA2
MAFLITAGVIVATLIAPIAVVGGVLYWLGHGRVRKLEAGGALFIGVLGLGVDIKGRFLPYLTWWPGAWWGASDWSAIPWLTMLLGGLVVAGFGLLLRGTAIAARLPHPLHKKAPSELESESILPTDAERAEASVAAPPGGFTAHIEDHSLLGGKDKGRHLPIGVSKDRNIPVYLTEDELGMHVVLFGATGSGKSETLKALVGNLADLGWSGIILDLKEDTKPGGLRDFCAEYASYHTLPYQELRLSDPEPTHWFNPFRGMGPDEARDTLLTLMPSDDFFWGALSSKLLGQGVSLLYDAHHADPERFAYPGPEGLATIFSKGAGMPAVTRDMRAAVQLSGMNRKDDVDYSTLKNPTQKEAENSPGFAAKIETIYQTSAGRVILRPPGEGENYRAELDITQPGLTYIGLDTMGKPDLSKMISSAVLQRISVEAAKRTTGHGASAAKPMFLVIDEASVVDRRIVQALLSKARSAKVTMVMATQGPLDWEVSQDTGKGQGSTGFGGLAQNLNVAIIMRQNDPGSAEICAELIGKRTVYQQSVSTLDGEVSERGTARQVEDYWVKPHQLTEMQIGEAILRVGAPKSRVTWLRVAMRDPRISPRRQP